MFYRRIYQLVMLAAWMVAAAGPSYAGANPQFTLPIHVSPAVYLPCDGYLPVDCLGVRPTVQVESGQQVAIFLMMANHTQVWGVQTAFEVDPSWVFYFGLWECHGSYEMSPTPPFGPTAGTIVLAFDNCVTSGALIPIGRMFFQSGTGCIGQVASTFPYGIYAFDCQQQIDQIFPNEAGQSARLGRVCVGPGGHDACEAATPVAAATWGQIKGSYR